MGHVRGHGRLGQGWLQMSNDLRRAEEAVIEAASLAHDGHDGKGCLACEQVSKAFARLSALRASQEGGCCYCAKSVAAFAAIIQWGGTVKKLEEAEGLDAVLLLAAHVRDGIMSRLAPTKIAGRVTHYPGCLLLSDGKNGWCSCEMTSPAPTPPAEEAGPCRCRGGKEWGKDCPNRQFAEEAKPFRDPTCKKCQEIRGHGIGGKAECGCNCTPSCAPSTEKGGEIK